MFREPKAKATTIATLGVDIGKNTFHLVGLDKGGAIVLHGLRKTAARRLAEAGCTASDRSRTRALRPRAVRRYTAFRYRPGRDYPLVEKVGMSGSKEQAF